MWLRRSIGCGRCGWWGLEGQEAGSEDRGERDAAKLTGIDATLRAICHARQHRANRCGQQPEEVSTVRMMDLILPVRDVGEPELRVVSRPEDRVAPKSISGGVPEIGGYSWRHPNTCRSWG